MAKSARDPRPKRSPRGELLLDLWKIAQRTAAAVGPDSREKEFLPYYRAILQADCKGLGWTDAEPVAMEFVRLVGRPFDMATDAMTRGEADALPLKRGPRARADSSPN
jgi:hypothetical protein